MRAPHWRLILNGKAANDDALRAAVADARGRGVRVDVRVTWEHGDAERYVAEAVAEGVDAVIAAGGDGTLSAVAGGLARQPAAAAALPALALVPLGTANDFAVAAGIPGTPDAALELVRTAPPRPVDLLRIAGAEATRWCANLASAGFGTQVTLETDEGLKKMLGGLAYLLTGIAKLGRIEPVRAALRGPGFEWTGEFIALGLGNGRQAGGGQALCPEALLDDGLIDLTVVPELSGEMRDTLGTLLTEGRHAALDRAALRARLAWVELDAPAPLQLNVDGEPVQAARFRIDCVPGRLRMHLPRDCPLFGRAVEPPAP